jgi:hypothetical protein
LGADLESQRPLTYQEFVQNRHLGRRGEAGTLPQRLFP